MDKITESYQSIVKIEDIEDFRLNKNTAVYGDRRDGLLYRYTDEAKLAINIALATGRPLLILGATGCGKSSLAYNLARVMKRRYYEFVVTSRSQARDLFYRYDAVRRLGDSQLGHNVDKRSGEAFQACDFAWQTSFPYIEPGPLWWIFDHAGAANRGCSNVNLLSHIQKAKDPGVYQEVSHDASSILLIDEIDKADPDFPNNLLVPLGSRQFTVEEITTTIAIDSDKQSDKPLNQPLIIITSNQQRELPDTFLRRCIVLKISSPAPEELVKLAETTFGIRNDKFYKNIASRLEEIHGKELSAAEFLDAVQAIEKLKATGSAQSEIIERSSWRSIERY
jgi:MoxR-like ATPase